ncbi:MAG: hypothetical protein PF503_02865 [Desulfobacula sp.]|jgi:hypothetical protein|nr:hypothetical protein [Desulfobacula sp.]
MGSNLFSFFISGAEKEVLPGSDLWELRLSGKDTRHSSNSSFTTGDYYLTACKFLSKDNFSILQKALGSFFNSTVHMDQITTVKVFLEKHGAFYHPLKIQVALNNSETSSFVMNGAVSSRGLLLMENEYDLLLKINQMYSKCYLPQIYGFDFVEIDKGRVGLFLGQWFDDYQEFHVTDDQDKRQIAIWESNGSCHYIDLSHGFKIYQEISRILTYYYNLETFEQISSWHNAAGDFIVNMKDDKLDIRMITVREYSPLTQLGAGKDDQKRYLLPSLLFFFLDLTIRIRFDRLNGTGKTIMIDIAVLNSVVKGFLSALDEKSGIYDYGNLREHFIEFFLHFDLGQIFEIMENGIEFSSSDPREILLIKENLNAHCRQLNSIFKNI